MYTDLYYTRLGAARDRKEWKTRCEMDTHGRGDITLWRKVHNKEWMCTRARVGGDGNDDDDNDGTPTIPKTLKEFILIKIKTSFKTPNNDTKETEKRNSMSEWNGNERAFAYYVMVNLVPRTYLPSIYVVCNNVALTTTIYRAPSLPWYFHLIYQMTFILANIARTAHTRMHEHRQVMVCGAS